MKTYIYSNPSNLFEKTSNILNRSCPNDSYYLVKKDYKLHLVKNTHRHYAIWAIFHVATMGLVYLLTLKCNSISKKRIEQIRNKVLFPVKNLSSENKQSPSSVEQIGEDHLLNHLPKDMYVMEIFKNLSFESMEQFSKLSKNFDSYKNDFIQYRAIPLLQTKLKCLFNTTQKGSFTLLKCQLSNAYIDWKLKKIDPSNTLKSIKNKIFNNEVDKHTQIPLLFIYAQFQHELGNNKESEKTVKWMINSIDTSIYYWKTDLVKKMVPILVKWKHIDINDVEKLIDFIPNEEYKTMLQLSLCEHRNITPSKNLRISLESNFHKRNRNEEYYYRAAKAILQNTSKPIKRLTKLKSEVSLSLYTAPNSYNEFYKKELKPFKYIFSGLFRAAIELDVPSDLSSIKFLNLDVPVEKETMDHCIISCWVNEISKLNRENGKKILEYFDIDLSFHNLLPAAMIAKEQGDTDYLKEIFQKIDLNLNEFDFKDLLKIASISSNPNKYLEILISRTPINLEQPVLLVKEITRLLGFNEGISQLEELSLDNNHQIEMYTTLLNMYYNEWHHGEKETVLDVCEKIALY